MTIIQPVTDESPFNQETLDRSGLPFSFVLIPYANRSAVSNGDDDQFNQTHGASNQDNKFLELKRARSKAKAMDHSTREDDFPIKATLIAKCSHCGAPLNPLNRFIQHWHVLCNLCGHVYDAHYDYQEFARKALFGDYGDGDDNDDEQEMMEEDYMTQEEAEYTRRYGSGIYQEECSKRLLECSLPLLQVRTKSGRNVTKKMKKDDVYVLPSNVCPPLLAIFIDGTSTNEDYYARIYSCLNHLIDTNNKDKEKVEYKGTRVGIFIMTQKGSLSVFDLTNPGGHLKNLYVPPPPLPLNSEYIPSSASDNFEEGRYLSLAEGGAGMESEEEDYDVAPLKDCMKAEQMFVPLETDYGRSCIENAIREIQDSRIAIGQACQRDSGNAGGIDGGLYEEEGVDAQVEESSGVYLGSTLQHFLEFMDDVAYHPGEMTRPKAAQEDDYEGQNKQQTCQKFLYAGGKIMCFLSKAPDDIGDVVIKGRNGTLGTGGFGGSCAELGKRFANNGDNNEVGLVSNPKALNETDPLLDIESGSLAKKPTNGKGNLGIGDKATVNGNATKSFTTPTTLLEDDLALLQTKYLGVGDYYQDLGKACAMSAFGVEIFALTDSYNDSEKKGESFIGIPFLRLLSDRSGGCGPLISSLQQNGGKDSESYTLMNELIARSPWYRATAFGSILRIRLSPSLCIDTSIDQSIKKSVKKNKKYAINQFEKYAVTNGMHGSVTSSTFDDEVFLIGACDQSHSLSFDVKIKSQSGDVESYVTVDGTTDYRLIPCIQTCFAYTSVVKNKDQWVTVRRLRVSTLELQLTDNTESLTSTLDPEALVVSLFHKLHVNSLENGLKSTEDYTMQWLLSALLCCYESAEVLQKKIKVYGTSASEQVLYTSDRLLDIPGSRKSKKDILLAQGHDELQHLPLLCFALIQCDALRPNVGDFNPSIDARAAAAANMNNMTPDVLARCIAPRLEFWVSGENSDQAIIESVRMTMEDVRYAIIDQIGVYENSGDDREEYDGPSPIMFLDSPSNVLLYDCQDLCKIRPFTRDEVPTSLIDCLNDAVNSYRVCPPNSSLDDRVLSSEDVFDRFIDALVEDSRTPLKHESYEKWSTSLAEILFSYVSDK